jgi:hypothetical protein
MEQISTSKLQNWYPTAELILDGANDHDFIGLNLPVRKAPFRDGVLSIVFAELLV